MKSKNKTPHEWQAVIYGVFSLSMSLRMALIQRINPCWLTSTQHDHYLLLAVALAFRNWYERLHTAMWSGSLHFSTSSEVCNCSSVCTARVYVPVQYTQLRVQVCVLVCLQLCLFTDNIYSGIQRNLIRYAVTISLLFYCLANDQKWVSIESSLGSVVNALFNSNLR